MGRDTLVVRVTDGLGNQLFQYALGRKLALLSGLRLKFDTSWYRTDGALASGREFLLFEFRVQGEPATDDELGRVLRQGSYLRRAGRRLARSVVPYHRRFHVVERRERVMRTSSFFDPRILSIRAGAYLCGYWASYKYFEDIRGVLRQDLTLKEPAAGLNRRLLREIMERNSVSVHVRRGDFLGLKEFGVCDAGYFDHAVEILKRRVQDPVFYVFSDDVAWARENLSIRAPATFVDHNAGRRCTEDFRLMASCKHHINSNSTFSWWAAWLGRHPDQVVIVPQEWFIGLGLEVRDLYPPEWLRLARETAVDGMEGGPVRLPNEGNVR